MMNIIQKRNIFLTISGIIVAASIAAFGIWGLKQGLDFTGGALLEIEYKADRPDVQEIRNALSGIELNSLVVQPIGEKGIVLRFQNTSEDDHQKVLAALAGEQAEIAATGTPATVQNDFTELRYDSVGPTIGAELKRRSVTAVVIALIGIVLYIAWTFRKVSKPVASWKYGLAATIALFHDVMITVGVFSVLGHFYGVEVNTPFIAAILTILGYSVNDTIVVFDRIRENLPKSNQDFEGTINTSLNQTFARSINTSMTVMLALAAVLFFGGSSIRDFTLAMLIGVFVGTYSSIFIASPILVIWEKMARR